MFDACICHDVDDRVTVISLTTPVARKPHKCCECGHTINPGKRYERQSTLFDGHFDVYKTCIPCMNVRDSMLTCGYYFGHVWEDIHEAYCDADYCICPDKPAEQPPPQ